MLKELRKDLQKLANLEQAKNLQKFFKTGNGEYAEGDIFLGIKVPAIRKLISKYSLLNLKEIQELLNSNIHEYRLTGLLILICQYKKSKNKKFVNFYLKNTKNINNWDLVDLSAHSILGDYLVNNDRKILYVLAKSKNFWEKRMSIVSTLAFIKENEFEDTFKISEILIKDKNDLIHKAVGWMLREVGKKNQLEEEKFLKKYYKKMPRTMLRYAIEKFEESKRKKYLKSLI